MARKSGILIVLAGIDGSGKATQTELLLARLRKEGCEAEGISFPRYESTFFGREVARYLRGEFGDAGSVSPELAPMLYAADRWESKPILERWLAAGRVVIANRYVSANKAHQGGKIADAAARKRFFEWVDRLEHEIFGLPRPDLSVLLHLPHTMAQELVDRKGARSYTGNRKRDIHEQDLAHLEKAEATYLEIASMEPNWATVACTDKGKLLSPENISEKLWERVRRVIEARTPGGSSTAPAPTDT